MLREVFAAACLMAIVPAPFAQAQDNSPSADQLSLVDQVCTQIMGLRRGEAYFARCRESLSQALPPGKQVLPIATADISGTGAGKSFYEVSPSVRWNRERQACARLGLFPESTYFQQCAAGLDGAFLTSQN